MIAIATPEQQEEYTNQLEALCAELLNKSAAKMCDDLDWPISEPYPTEPDELEALSVTWSLHMLARILLKHAPSPRTGVEILLAEFDAANDALPANAHSAVYTVVTCGTGLRPTK